ncbi:MAG: Holliday junction branch migration protein RuvA [Chlorobiaceae bacterium]|nr:Holliday junction branch migration protein RuvA [Chlorobiaceae bacterium]MBA4309490.1 Holliday junction branch migration protein RuvA [Chlorobiaceae bacterium]
MIGYLKGKIISSKPTQLIIDVLGVGYLVQISISTFEKISQLNEVSLFIYTSVKEDSITLFGFYEESEKEMFKLLISVNGIGPKSAQSILSGITVDSLKDAIETGNINRIVAIPGIGRKTAERLIIELRGKVDEIISGSETNTEVSSRTEAISALTTLGYNIKIAEKIIKEVLAGNPNLGLEDLIRQSLMSLNKS